MKIKKVNEIKTAKSVEEFRNNLKKYFICVGQNREYLYVQTDKTTTECDINSIESLSDLYEKYNTSVVSITPTINFNVHDVLGKDKSELEVFEINKNQWSDQNDFMTGGNPCWYKIDNQILRSFYIQVLGDYSGYSLVNQEVA